MFLLLSCNFRLTPAMDFTAIIFLQTKITNPPCGLRIGLVGKFNLSFWCQYIIYKFSPFCKYLIVSSGK